MSGAATGFRHCHRGTLSKSVNGVLSEPTRNSAERIASRNSKRSGSARRLTA